MTHSLSVCEHAAIQIYEDFDYDYDHGGHKSVKQQEETR